MSSSEKIEQVVGIIKEEVLRALPAPVPGKDAEVDYGLIKKFIVDKAVPGKDADEINYDKVKRVIKQLVIHYSVPGKSPKVDYNKIREIIKTIAKPGKDAEINYDKLESLIKKYSVPGKAADEVDYDSIKKFIKKQYVPPGMDELEALIVKHAQPAEITKEHLEQIALLVPQETAIFPVHVVDIVAKKNAIVIVYSDGTDKEVPLELLFSGGGGGGLLRKRRTKIYESRLKVLGSPILENTNISLDSFTGISGKISSLGNSASEFNNNSGLYIWVDGVKGLKGTLADGDDIEYVNKNTFKVFRQININEILTIEEIG